MAPTAGKGKLSTAGRVGQPYGCHALLTVPQQISFMHFAHLVLRNPRLLSAMWVLLLMPMYFQKKKGKKYVIMGLTAATAMPCSHCKLSVSSLMLMTVDAFIINFVALLAERFDVVVLTMLTEAGSQPGAGRHRIIVRLCRHPLCNLMQVEAHSRDGG